MGSVKKLLFGTSKAGVTGGGYGRRLKRIEPSYEEMIGRYLAEGRIKCAIDELSGSTVGPGFYTTADDKDAKAVVDDFCEEIDADGLLQLQCKDLWLTGNTLFKQLETDNQDWPYTFKRVPIQNVKAARGDPATARLVTLQLHEKTAPRLKIKGSDLEPFRLWTWNPIDTGVIGRGNMEPYVRQGYGYRWKSGENEWKMAYRPSIAETNEEIQDYMRVAVTRYSPRFMLDLAGFGEDEANSIKNNWNDLQWYDDAIVYHEGGEDKKITPHRLTTDPRNRLDQFIKHFADIEQIGMETPGTKLISETSFTEASSRTAERVGLRIISPMKRFIKRHVELDYFKAILVDKLDYGPKKLKLAKVRLHWNEETEPELTFADIHQARQNKGITLEEYRKNLTKFGMETTEDGLAELQAEIEEAQAREQEKWQEERNQNGNNNGTNEE